MSEEVDVGVDVDVDFIEVKFRLYDGSDIGPFRYSPSSTVDHLKNGVLADWPKDKTVAPKSVNEIKIVSAGKILENYQTVGQCRMPFGELQEGVITMHVVVQPSPTKTKIEKKIDESGQKCICSCSIL